MVPMKNEVHVRDAATASDKILMQQVQVQQNIRGPQQC